MNYADIKQYDTANGIGIRVSLFVSGCTHHCKSCFNQVAWDFNYGTPFTEDSIQTILSYLSPSYVTGLSLLGGEPLEHVNQKALLALVRQIKQVYPNKTIWCYTGYLFEDIVERMCEQWSETKELLSYFDVLVDGQFNEKLKDMRLAFRGSSNQRIIMVKESLANHTITLWSPPDYDLPHPDPFPYDTTHKENRDYIR